MNKYRSAMGKITVSSQMEERIIRNLQNATESSTASQQRSYLRWIKPAGIVACCAAFLAAMVISPSFMKKSAEQPILSSELTNIPWETSTQQGEERIQPPELASKPEETVTQQEVQPTPSLELASKPEEIGTQQEEQAAPSHELASKPEEAGAQQGEQSAQLPGLALGEQPVLSSSPMMIMKNIDELKKKLPFELLVPTKLPTGYKIEEASILSGKLAQVIYSNGSDTIGYRASKGTEDVSGDYSSYEASDALTVGDAKVTVKGGKSLIRLAIWNQNGCSYSLSFSAGVEKDAVVSIIKSMKKA